MYEEWEKKLGLPHVTYLSVPIEKAKTFTCQLSDMTVKIPEPFFNKDVGLPFIVHELCHLYMGLNVAPFWGSIIIDGSDQEAKDVSLAFIMCDKQVNAVRHQFFPDLTEREVHIVHNCMRFANFNDPMQFISTALQVDMCKVHPELRKYRPKDLSTRLTHDTLKKLKDLNYILDNFSDPEQIVNWTMKTLDFGFQVKLNNNIWVPYA